jgi:replication initiation protein RepC
MADYCRVIAKMRHISTTPFGRRSVTAGLLAHQMLSETPAPVAAVDKWQVLRDLTEARATFQISDRDLAVLAALISFHPDKILQDDSQLIVFPSNASLSNRTHGMAESTLRRHLAALVGAGLILRHDSPNGKRYAMRGTRGKLTAAFGFDLRPLLIRSDDIAQAAQQARDLALRSQALRQEIVLLLRDAAKLLVWSKENALPVPDGTAGLLAELQRLLRRKLDLETLTKIHADATFLRRDLSAMTAVKTEKSRGNDSQNERHNQSSDSYLKESESCNEQEENRTFPPGDDDLPLQTILAAAPEITSYASEPIRSWGDLTRMADFLSPMLGIEPAVWQNARRTMGPEPAAVTLACILQRRDHIRRPPAYLRSLTSKAAKGAFSPGPMVRALLNTLEKHAA